MPGIPDTRLKDLVTLEGVRDYGRGLSAIALKA